VARCLAKDADEQFQSADLLMALQWAENSSIAGTAVWSAGPDTPSLTLVEAATAAAVAALLLAYGGTDLRRPSPSRS
jgi:hypothetical protein